MANPLITLQGLDKPQGVQSFMTGVSQGAEAARIPMQNRLLEAQTKGAEQQLTRQQAEFQLQDMATDALQIKELAQVDPMRAQVALAERIKKITDRGGDPSDTMAVRELLTAGRMDEFNAELDAPINAARQRGLLGGGEPSELKVGRFRELKLPDGSTATLDTATNEVTKVASAPEVDLSVVPKEMRDSVSRQPADIQRKVVESFASPSGQAKTKEAQQQEEKAREVTEKTKSLVSELLGNLSGVKAVTGGLDEMTPTFLPGSKDAEASLEDLRNLLTVENLGLMSGVLSESDIKILKSVGASGLSGSQERVIKTLQDMGAALGISQQGSAQVGRFKVRAK